MGKDETVLFVDDEPALADGHAARLADWYNTMSAYDGKATLETIDDTVDVVFLDRRMPDMAGKQVLESIRDAGYDCDVVMLTGVEPDADVIEMGFDEYLVKPVDTDELRDTIDRLRSGPADEPHDQILDTLGDPKTRHCWYTLATESMSAQELAETTGYSLPTVYRRLHALRQADLITSQIELDPGGDHYESFTAVPTRIEVEITDGHRVDIEQPDTQTA